MYVPSESAARCRAVAPVNRYNGHDDCRTLLVGVRSLLRDVLTQVLLVVGFDEQTACNADRDRDVSFVVAYPTR
ncbi:hypothetical protein HSBGL_0069 [Halapricum desulfuricans]|uniref:Uncharacterized protein n=1 Tax=Halapricum desulfuricans TaxID=2841257 RepID=A0A897NGE3_9EURY|nr:hypothetical protein HSBGL_0069 [Halapricum desulfuricans]